MMALARLSDYLIPLLLAGAAVYALGAGWMYSPL